MKERVTVAVMCGGRGQRMGAGHGGQKCMLPIAGKPILGHLLDRVAAAFEAARVFLVTAHRGHQVKEFFGNAYAGLAVEYKHRAEVGGLRQALVDVVGRIDEDLLMLHGDILCSVSGLQRLHGAFLEYQPAAAVLVATRHDVAKTHPVVQCEGQRVRSLEYPPQHLPEGPNEGRYMGADWYSLGTILDFKRLGHIETIVGSLGTLLCAGRGIIAVPYEERWMHFAEPGDFVNDLD